MILWICQKNIESLALQLYGRLHLRLANTLKLTGSSNSAALSIHKSSSLKDGVAGDPFKTSSVWSAMTVYMPENKFCSYYRLTDGGGYLSSVQVKEQGWKITPTPCSELKLKSLVEQCEQWMRTHLQYRPVRYNLPGPGQMELKVDLPKVG